MNDDDLEFRCRDCGEVDSIVGVSMVPRIKGVRPDGEGGIEWKDVPDTEFLEAEVDMGFACENERCKFWQGDVHVSIDDDNIDMTGGWTIDKVAEVVRPVEVTAIREVTETIYATVDPVASHVSSTDNEESQ